MKSESFISIITGRAGRKMLTAIAIIHILAAIALVLIVLLQTGRGSEIGAAFGSGASQTLFGSSGTSGFMTRITTGVVVIFMVTSLVLAILVQPQAVLDSVCTYTERTGCARAAPLRHLLPHSAIDAGATGNEVMNLDADVVELVDTPS